ncbi:FAD/NAD(P)-binding domain-containing protein, partial [Ascobolus immersus RN42]
RDVAIIGGGSAGTYATFSLLSKNTSVILFERKSRLGGHTETYHDTVTGSTYDIGVYLFHDQPHVHKYLARFGLKLANWSPDQLETKYADFRTGVPVPGPTFAPNQTEIGAALGRYAAQLAKYPRLADGWYVGNPVPEDLLLSTREWVEKYDLHAAVPLFWSFSDVAGLLDLPALYLLKYLSPELLEGMASGKIVTTEKRDNSELYEKATEELKKGGNVFLNADIRKVKRDVKERGRLAEYPVEISIVGKDGKRTTVRAKKVLIAAPPKLKNIEGWLDVTKDEKNLFKSFKSVDYHTGLLRNSGIPAGININNVGLDTPYSLPAVPGVYAFGDTRIPGITSFRYGSISSLSEETVKSDVELTLSKLRRNGVFNPYDPGAIRPEFVMYSNHSPFTLHVKASLIRDGFYDKLYGLQGKRNTFWSGAAFAGEDSSDIWKFTEGLMPEVVKSL